MLIVEKEKFPRFHIGESVMPVSNAILRDIGVWDKVDRAGFVPKHGAEFHVANKSVLPKHVEFSKGLVPGLDYTYQVERSRFDQILLQHAAELGCEVREETKATAARPLGRDGYEVTLQPAGDRTANGPRPLCCTWIIDATGRDTIFARPIRTAPANPALAKRVAIYAHFGNVKRPPGKAGGNIVIIRNADGWVWFIPLERRPGVGRRRRDHGIHAARRGSSPRRCSGRPSPSRPNSPPRWRTPNGARKFHVTADYNYRARTFCRPAAVAGRGCGLFPGPDVLHGRVHRVALGKAGGGGGHRRTPAAGRRFRGGQRRRYTRRLGKNLATLERMVLAFYDDASFSVFMERNAAVADGPRPSTRWWRAIPTRRGRCVGVTGCSCWSAACNGGGRSCR